MAHGIEHWNIRHAIRKNKVLLKLWSGLLSTEIQRQGNVRNPPYLDFRFLLPLAQWLAEQVGYNAHPDGNNPGNVMGSGDLGQFLQRKNREVVNGKLTLVPAYFAKYSTLEVGTTGYFNMLKSNWPRAHEAIIRGGSVEEFVNGLYPGKPHNYATTARPDYLSGCRARFGNAIKDYIEAANDDDKELDEYEKDHSAAHDQVEVGKYLNGEIVKELKEVEKRYKARRAIQPES